MYRLLCDDMLVHGTYLLEILPAGQPDQGRTKPTKPGKKAESMQDRGMDMHAAQAIVRQLNVNDLKVLEQALERFNTSVCHPCFGCRGAVSFCSQGNWFSHVWLSATISDHV